MYRVSLPDGDVSFRFGCIMQGNVEVGRLRATYGAGSEPWRLKREALINASFTGEAAERCYFRPSLHRPVEGTTKQKGAYAQVPGLFEIVDRETRHAFLEVHTREADVARWFAERLATDLWYAWVTLPLVQQLAPLKAFTSLALKRAPDLKLSFELVGTADPAMLADLSEFGRIIASPELEDAPVEVAKLLLALKIFESATAAPEQWTYRQNLADQVLNFGARLLSGVSAVTSDAIRERAEQCFAEPLSQALGYPVQGRWFPREHGYRF